MIPVIKKFKNLQSLRLTSEKITDKSLQYLKKLQHLEVINIYTEEFKRIPSIDRTLANRYQLELGDVQKWLSMTRWSQEQFSTQVIENVQNTLLDLNLISNNIAPGRILTSL